ncbi:MAG: hypothetical protein N0C81_19825 [Candidatus Thiodiazotropha lotti]|nr:hypothetical protein [Candidatus Thiodiazotropha lotti]MCW4197472.1 hypothetical protein [Candidatus Thiodiazotropha lotti]
MSDLQEVIFAVVIYKSLSVFAGVLSIYLGYRLFQSGVYEKAGELKAAWGEKHLALKQAAPGTFFSLFGAVVIAASIAKGMNIEHIANSISSQDSSRSGLVLGGNPYLSPMMGVSSWEVPHQVLSSIEKMSNGEKISPEEREKLESWVARAIEVKTNIKANLLDLEHKPDAG